MALTESRLHQLLPGQSSIARKIFDHVPIQQPWSAHDVHNAALAVNATSVAVHAVRRALGELKDAGLIREPVAGKFQRDAITLKSKKEPAMPQTANQKTVVPIKKADGALDALLALSGELVSLSADCSQRMKALAARIDEVALAIEAERESNAEKIRNADLLHAAFQAFSK